MDFSEAFRILQQRQQQGPNSAQGNTRAAEAQSTGQPVGQVLDVSGLEDIVQVEIPLEQLSEEPLPEVLQLELQPLGDLKLLELFQELQGKRVQTYTVYNKSLRRLLELERLDQYQFVCRSVTEQFNRINAEFRRLAEEFTRRERQSWARLVQDLQTQEREKLTMVAALHLDDCREHWMQKNDSASELQALLVGKASTARRIQLVEEKVREIMDEVQVEKSELFESLPDIS